MEGCQVSTGNFSGHCLVQQTLRVCLVKMKKKNKNRLTIKYRLRSDLPSLKTHHQRQPCELSEYFFVLSSFHSSTGRLVLRCFFAKTTAVQSCVVRSVKDSIFKDSAPKCQNEKENIKILLLCPFQTESNRRHSGFNGCLISSDGCTAQVSSLKSDLL